MATRAPSPEPEPIRIQAACRADLQAIRHLLHRTFVTELGQHVDHGEGGHRDQFEDKNHVFLAWKGGILIGMIAVHGEAPFSVAKRLPPGRMEEIADKPLEVRLLSVVPSQRHSRLAFQLMATAYNYAAQKGFRQLWISGVEEQLPLYKRIGFHALGPPVPDGDVAFTPMCVTLKDMHPGLVRLAQRLQTESQAGNAPSAPPVSLLPGPARLNQKTLKAAASSPLYHRSEAFLHTYYDVHQRLAPWFRGHSLALFPGGGTFANDVLAQTLLRLPDATARPGLILCNGEFSRRLLQHATGAHLPHQVLDFGWGQPWDFDAIQSNIQTHRPAWIWAVHCESSTSMLAPIEALVELLTADPGDPIPLCLDAISTLGAMPLPAGVAFSSTVSGKAFQALPGIAIVSAAPEWKSRLQPTPWPPSMALPDHLSCKAPPHTLGYPVLAALQASLLSSCAVEHIDSRTLHFQALGREIRQNLRHLGVCLIASESQASPVMTTFEVPSNFTTLEFLDLASSWGFQLAGHSGYLRNRRLAQIATYGDFKIEELAPLFAFWRQSNQNMSTKQKKLASSQENEVFSRFRE